MSKEILRQLQPVSNEAVGYRFQTLTGRRLEHQIDQLRILVDEAAKKHSKYASWENNLLVHEVFASSYKVPNTRIYIEIWSNGDPRKNSARELTITFIELVDDYKKPNSLSLVTTGYAARVRRDKAMDLANFKPKQLLGLANLIKDAINIPQEVFERVARR